MTRELESTEKRGLRLFLKIVIHDKMKIDF